MKKKYVDSAHLLFTNLESLMYEVERAVIYADIVNSREIYDLSTYPITDPKYNADLVLNKPKGGGSAIPEYIGLRPKRYSFLGIMRIGLMTC